MTNKINKKELSLKISQLSERDVYILTKTLHTGDAGIFIYNKNADKITNLILLKLISPKSEYTKFGYYYVVNKNYRDVISELLLSKRSHK